MAGLGSGRPARWPSLWSLYSVRAKQVRKACGFRPGSCGHVTFSDGTQIEVRTADGELLVNGVRVALAWTEPHLGGRRAWLVCPGCGRRCTVLYGAERRWGCRRCWRANYPSQKEGRLDRLVRRAATLRRRLRPDGAGVPSDHADTGGTAPPKPPHMRWRTYQGIVDELERFEASADQLMYQRATRLLQRLARKEGFTP